MKNIGLIISPSDDGWPAEVGALAKCLFDLDDSGKNLSGVTFHFEASAGFTSLCVGVQPSCSLFDSIVLAVAVVTPCGAWELQSNTHSSQEGELFTILAFAKGKINGEARRGTC